MGAFRGYGNPSADCIDPCGKFAWGERFCNIIVRAEHKTVYLIHFLGFCGKHYDSDCTALFSDALANGKAVDSGHHDIKKHNAEIIRRRFKIFYCVLAAGGINNFVTCPAKGYDLKFADGVFIFANKDFFHFGFPPVSKENKAFSVIFRIDIKCAFRSYF